MSGTPNETARNLLREVFGHDAFRHGQEPVVEALLAGRPALAVFPTGGGKSLCYQLPALLLEGLTLVVSPLIALMKDQVDRLVERGIAAARLDSTLSTAEAAAVFTAMNNGTLKLLYVAPERLSSESFQQRLRKVKLAMIAIDEAHCISEWGHNFRPDYLKLARLCRRLRVKRVLALTATATPAVSREIRETFGIKKADEVRLSFHRPNLDLRVTPCTLSERKQVLVERLREAPEAAAVVYVTRQETAEEVATHLQRAGFRARAYHAGLPDEFRAEAQQDFMKDRTNIIVATIAFGMGIDKADIRRVLHYNLPKSLENYSQEIGRAGRDGQYSICEMLACGDDLTTLENFVFGDTPSRQAVRNLMDHLLRQGAEFDVSVYDLSMTTDIRPLVVTTVLAYLELEGVIEATRVFYAEYRVKPLRTLDQICAGYDARRQKFLRNLFAAGNSARLWTSFVIDEVAMKMGEPRDKIVAAITWLQDAGDIVIERRGVRQGYRILSEPEDLTALTGKMDERFQRREQSDIARIGQVLALAEADTCLTGVVTAHFGEVLDASCDHCDRCRGIAPSSLVRTTMQDVAEEDWAVLRSLVDARHPALRTPRQLARFLAGITSPATTRAKLTRHDAFGLMNAHPFEEILRTAEAWVV